MMTLLQENYSNLNLRIAITAMGLSLAFVPSISTANDKSIIVPVFELYHTDNLNGGTTSAQFNNNGTLVSTPLNMKPKSGTVYKAGAIWANAYSTSLGTTKLSISPFLFMKDDSENYAPSQNIGSSFNLTLLDTAERSVIARLAAGRIMPKLNADKSNYSSVGLKFKQVIDPTQNITFSVASSSVNIIANSTSDPTNNSISASYSKNLDSFKLNGGVKFTDRKSKTASFSGTDQNVFLEVKYPMGRHDIYAKYSHTESSDDAIRTTQAALREQTSQSYEVGYSMPIPVTDLAKLTFYANRLDASSNLALYQSETTTFGLKASLNF